MEDKNRDDIINESNMKSDEVKDELYMYVLKGMAMEKAKNGQALSNLTNLYKIKSFFFMCNEMVKEKPDEKYAVFVMDISQFKAVNEFCGRKMGDGLLIHIADVLHEYEVNRPNTIACHIRADNFALCTTYNERSEVEDMVINVKKKIYEYPLTFRVLPSFGICFSTEREPSVSHLKDCATIAMQSIKGKFFSDYAVFDDDMRRSMLREKQIESDVVGAMEDKQIIPFIQPKVDMRNGEIVGGEALVRWKSPTKGLISPGVFVPVLEKNGYIINVDKYVWECIFLYQSELKKAGRKLVPISINVSRMHMYDPTLTDTLINLSSKYDVEGKYVPLELTESAFLADEDGLYNKMKVLRKCGFEISIDDFGTGYSSMNMLRTQPVDEVKMDRTFIIDLSNEKSKIILEYTAMMLNAMNMNVIVEGVETEEQKEQLLKCGCTKAQGFYFHRPMPIEDFDALLINQEKTKR